MKTKIVFLGTYDKANGTGTGTVGLTNGEAGDLAGHELVRIIPHLRTAITSGGTPACRLRTGSAKALNKTATAQADWTTSTNLLQADLRADLSTVLSAADVANRFHLDIATAALLTGVVDFYGEVIQPRN